MATAAQQNNFIQEIAPLIVKYARQYGYKVASTTIAQACIESAYGNAWSRRYNNYFGIKYGSWTKRTNIADKISVVNAKTQEEYRVGYLTTIVDGFCKCPTMELGVQLYFEFLRVNSRYAGLKNCSTAQAMAQGLKDAGYATSSRYVPTLMSCVQAHGLTKYDAQVTASQPVKEVKVPAGKKTYKVGNYTLYDVTYAPTEKSETVKFLQQLLNAKNHAGLAEDGLCGDGTLRAIADYQSKVLHSTTCGKGTWEALLK